jgi:hypothetical protein
LPPSVISTVKLMVRLRYLDEWDWSSGGNAKVPGTKRKDPPAP